MYTKFKSGFSVIEVLIVIVIIAGLGTIGYMTLGSKQAKDKGDSEFTQMSGKSANSSTTKKSSGKKGSSSKVTWAWSGSAWQASGKAPACDEPLTLEQSPVDVSLASHKLLPGQARTGGYKPHGGFRFDGKNNSDITVKAPLNSNLRRASRYIERGETQYLLEFISDCGIMYRFDHLLTLAPKFQAVADTLPAAQVDDSRTTDITTDVIVSAGETIGTAVGFEKTKNVSVDFGVYDLRQPNQASKDAAWLSQHQSDKELAAYALCWFSMLPGDDSQVAQNLKTSGSDSAKSDYCK